MRRLRVTALSLAALTACPGAIVGGGSAGAGGSTSTDTAQGAAGADAATDAAHGACWICACETYTSAGGCADTGCDPYDTLPGPMPHFFCLGEPPMSQCAECIVQRCGVSDPAQCK